MKNVTVTKFELTDALTVPEPYENGKNFDGNTFVARFCWQENVSHFLRIDQSHSESVKNVPFLSFSSIRPMSLSKCAGTVPF